MRGRVDRLTATVGSPDVCACKPAELRVRYSNEPEDARPAPPCATCGRPREVVRLRVVYADEVRA